MTVKDLQILFDYSHWANRKLFTAMSSLTPEQLAEPVSGKHGSVRNTMVHILSAEWGWIGRCGGPERGPALEAGNYSTVAALVALDKQIEELVRVFLASLRDEDLARIVEFTLGGPEKRSMPVGELLQHAANHAAHHRGQVSLVLRMLGYSPDNFDLLFFFADKHGQNR
jgi:uncharacterized damage-inducible protein DinB